MNNAMLDSRNVRRAFLGFVAAVGLCFGGLAPAQAQMAPDAMVKKVTEDVLATVKSDQGIKSGDTNEIRKLVEQKILPYVNFQKMTASAVGPGWSKASPQQQQQITDQFRQLLIYTYSGALSDVRDQQVQYQPFRGDANGSVAQVNTRVVNPRGGEPIQLNYKLEKDGADWKIIDVNVLGVWLVQNYRDSFASQVSQGGIDGLIKALTSKNEQLARGGGARKG